jgi:hypothetical protein
MVAAQALLNHSLWPGFHLVLCASPIHAVSRPQHLAEGVYSKGNFLPVRVCSLCPKLLAIVPF